MQARRFFFLLASNYGVANLGYFIITAILSLFFLEQLHLPPVTAGVLMFLHAAAVRIAGLMVVPWVRRVEVGRSIGLALCLAGLGYGGLGYAVTQRQLGLIAASTLVAGIGFSLNQILVKSAVAQVADLNMPHLIRYAGLSVALNVSAAIGPLCGVYLFHVDPALPFYVAAGTFGLGALGALCLPRQPVLPVRSSFFYELKDCLMTSQAIRSVVLVTIVALFAYQHLFVFFPLYVSAVLHSQALLGTFFTVNAMLVIGCSVPLNMLWHRLRLSHGTVVALSLCLFGVGYVGVALHQSLAMAYGAMVLWTIGEIGMLTALNAMIAEQVGSGDHRVAFAINAIAMGVGQSLGGLVFTSVGTYALQSASSVRHFYLALALFCGVAALVGRRAGGAVNQQEKGRCGVRSGL